ncbi:hypothetical protein PanWU01x14_227270, partial [Parasponia andersonii]
MVKPSDSITSTRLYWRSAWTCTRILCLLGDHYYLILRNGGYRYSRAMICRIKNDVVSHK